jgi:hypothetical protein
MDYDVIVCGGGTAGAVAGVAAARHGARTLIVEQFGFLGGTQTGALVMPLMRYHAGEQQLVTGLHQEILDRCNALPGDNEGDFFNYELLKYVLEDMVLEAGCDLLYHSFIHAALGEPGRVTGVEVVNKSGHRVLSGRQVVDCTGDADVAALAGVRCESGRPEDGLNQSASLRFAVGGVDLPVLAEFIRANGGWAPSAVRFGHGFARGGSPDDFLGRLMRQAEEEGALTEEEGAYLQFFTVPGRPGELCFNAPRITHTNGARAEDLTQAQIRGRRMIPHLVEFCRRYLPGFGNAYLAHTAPMVGVRESRRITGLYTLTLDDFRAARKFEDGIARSSYMVDIHNPAGGGVAVEHIPEGDYQEIPYRCLVPRGVDNLLVAGRCISASFEAQSAIRIEPTCRAMGEAAGVAAALCAREGVPPRELDTALLLETLRAQGANVHGG